jgi:hypothetical protein
MREFFASSQKFHCNLDQKMDQIILYDKVYDMSLFEHPGGKRVIRNLAEKDATQLFEKVGHSNAHLQKLQRYVIGVVPMCGILGLSNDIWKTILSYLDIKAKVQLLRTCRHINRIVRSCIGCGYNIDSFQAKLEENFKNWISNPQYPCLGAKAVVQLQSYQFHTYEVVLFSIFFSCC